MATDLRTVGRTIHAGVILTQGVTELVDVAPFEIFAWMGDEGLSTLNLPAPMQKEAVDLELHWVTEKGEIAQMRSRAQIKPTDSFETCPPLDIVLMGAHDLEYHINDAEREFIQKSFKGCSAFLTICGGVFPLLEAGVLEGLSATAPRMAIDLLKKTAPAVNWVDKRWVHDGKLWSSSSLLNGTDLMRAYVTHVWGGNSGMIEALLDAGHWPDRDVDFKDYKGTNFAVETFTK